MILILCKDITKKFQIIVYKKGIEKCHRDPSFDRTTVKQINNHSIVTDQKLTRGITTAGKIV
ncbi:hypothetical protein BpHYR1_049213 [Brachionus plicatilis]|uniref:Uncharacterized protein n=1 Tax=Brachionus plicatilis TaxID=10195 RepID=A0A3M7RXG3_BRAPC|nr:hypothetical protein BpHYR1_049213 [Brachionus plicatilis]